MSNPVPADPEDVASRIAQQTLAKREAGYATEVRRLLDAALAEMRRCGTTSRPRVADIVAAAGLSNDAFYRHFPSKDALVAAILEDGTERLRSYLDHQMAKEATPEGKVRRWVEGVLAQAADEDIASTTLAVLWNGGTVGEGPAAGRPSAAGPLATLLWAPFIALGSPAPELGASLAAHAVVGQLYDYLWGRVRPSRADIDHVTRFCLAVGAAGAGPRPVSFHLFLPQMRMPVDAIVDRARAAEAAGFEGIALMDHLAPPLATGHDMWEAMTLATWLLARTESLVVGHLVLCDPLRHPAVLARAAASLDHASGGRFELGIGWGSVQDELVAFGVGAAPPRDRVARLGESLEIMRALWTGEPVTYDGRFFQLRDAQQRPVPTRPIPIVIGGVGDRTLSLVRAHADWWNVPIHELGRLDERRTRAGDARVSVQTMVGLVPTEADRAAVTETVTRRFGGWGSAGSLAVGTAGELAGHFARLRDRGVERFYVWFADFAPPATLAGFADVIAAVGAGGAVRPGG